MKKLILLALITFLFFSFTWAIGKEGYGITTANSIPAETRDFREGSVQIGQAETIRSNLPFHAGRKYNYTQSLYLQSEIDMAGQLIDSLYYHFNGYREIAGDMTIYMGHTAQDSISDWTPYPALTEVYNGKVTFPAEDGWCGIELNNPFAYNNVDNLVIAVYIEMASSGYSMLSQFYQTQDDRNRSIFFSTWSSVEDPDPMNPPEVENDDDSGYSNYYPDLKLHFQDSSPAPAALVSPESADYGTIAAGSTADPYGETFQLINNGAGTLTVTSVTDLSGTDFTTTFNKDVELGFSEWHSFGFTYAPTEAGEDNVTFEIETNGGTVSISLTGEAYQLPEDMVEVGTEEFFDPGLEILPFDPFRSYSYSQSVFLQSEINLADKQIEKIYYHYNGFETFNSKIKVYMGHTSQDALTDWIPVTELTQVYSGWTEFPSAYDHSAWVEITLDTPFVYNNVDNLVIAVDENTAGSVANGADFYCSYVDDNKSIYVVSHENQDPANPPAIGETEVGDAHLANYRPNIRMQFQDLPGDITGNVTLDGGAGTVTDVLVQANGVSTNPDETGFYSLEIQAGTYDVTATREHYGPVTISSVAVETQQITAGYDFTLIPLPTPQNLTATEIGSATWEVPATGDVLYYSVYLDSVLVDTTSALTWQYTGLAGGENYMAGVSAQYAEGESELIEYEFTFSVNSPQNLAVTETGSATWEAPATGRSARAFSSYNVYLDGESVGTTTDLFWQHTGLVSGQTYVAGVSANYDQGESELIEYEFTFSVDAPQNLAVTELGLAAWEAPAAGDVLYYSVYLDSVLIDTASALTWQYEELVNGQTYLAAVSARYEEGESEIVTVEFTYNPVSSDNNIVAGTALSGNYPNPFNPETTISFTLTTENTERNTEIVVYNLKGQKVRTLVNDKLAAGHHTVTWNGTDDAGKPVSSGIYFYRMLSGKYTATRKMVLMK